MWPDGRGRNITECFDRTIPFSFDPTEILQSVSQSDMSLSRIWWPDVITGDFRAFALTNRVMTVLYCIGVGVAGAGVLARIGLAIAGARRQSMVEGLLFLVRQSSVACDSCSRILTGPHDRSALSVSLSLRLLPAQCRPNSLNL